MITLPPTEGSDIAKWLEEQVGELLAPHEEDWSGDEHTGFWDWWVIGGRWPRELAIGDGQPHLIAGESWSWARPTEADAPYVAERKALWQPWQVDACPAAAIDHDRMGMMRVDRLRVRYQAGPKPWEDPADWACTEESFIRQRLEPYRTYRVLGADGATFSRPEPWDILGDDWMAARDTPEGQAKMAEAEADYSKRYRAAITAAAEAGHWVTVVDYHC